MYYFIENNEYIFFSHISNKLPLEGWMHNCIVCGNFTSQIIPYQYLNSQEKLFCHICICNYCRKSNNYLDYQKRINKFIRLTLKFGKQQIYL